MTRQAISRSVTLPTRTATLASVSAAKADALSRLPVCSGSPGQANARQSVLDNTGGRGAIS